MGVLAERQRVAKGALGAAMRLESGGERHGFEFRYRHRRTEGLAEPRIIAVLERDLDEEVGDRLDRPEPDLDDRPDLHPARSDPALARHLERDVERERAELEETLLVSVAVPATVRMRADGREDDVLPLERLELVAIALGLGDLNGRLRLPELVGA